MDGKKIPECSTDSRFKEQRQDSENLKSSEMELSDAFLAELEEELAKHEIYGHRGFVEDQNTRFIRK